MNEELENMIKKIASAIGADQLGDSTFKEFGVVIFGTTYSGDKTSNGFIFNYDNYKITQSGDHIRASYRSGTGIWDFYAVTNGLFGGGISSSGKIYKKQFVVNELLCTVPYGAQGFIIAF